MSKLINCKSCEKEVASSAKVCPHCGKKLKMGKMMKLLILVVIIIIAVVVGMPSDDDIAKEITTIQNSQPSNIDSKEMREMFAITGDSTKLQKDKTKEKITGKIVQWSNLTVFNVSVVNQEKMIYRIQTEEDVFSSTREQANTFINLYARNSSEASKIESLTGGDRISVKGKITGVAMFGNVEIDYARLVKWLESEIYTTWEYLIFYLLSCFVKLYL